MNMYLIVGLGNPENEYAKTRHNMGFDTINIIANKSVVQEIGTEEFPRVRIGIGTPEHKNDVINYVIGHITDEEYEILQTGVKKASEAIEEIIKNGIDIAMNKYN